MKLNINEEEYKQEKVKKYASIAMFLFIIFFAYFSFALITKAIGPITWFLLEILSAALLLFYAYIRIKKSYENIPYLILNDKNIICNFKQVPTKQGSIKRKLFGNYETIKEQCELNVITYYELTETCIVAYGYSNKDLKELTGFVIDRFFDEKDEKLIVNWLKKHFSNIYNSKTKYLLK